MRKMIHDAKEKKSFSLSIFDTHFFCMTLIKSISGFRGTIGPTPGEDLTPLDVVKFSAAYGNFIQKSSGKEKVMLVVGRDARISGEMIQQLVMNTLIGMGIDILDAGLTTTPTVEWAVKYTKADGGVILTASHNPKEWNALKLLNSKGEFISSAEGNEVLKNAEQDSFTFTTIDQLGTIKERNFMREHLAHILDLKLVDTNAIQNRNFKIVVDGINSSGGIYVPALLDALGVENIIPMNCKADGNFAHNPEPLKEHLVDICKRVQAEKADLGIVVDPDVDRLAFVSEDGTLFGEEYTLVAIADYILGITPGPTVSNLSSSRALADISKKHGQTYFSSAVGEVNVVEQMKACNAVIGGEGNGGVIYPETHYGRDALVGIALFLSHLAKNFPSTSALRATLPHYEMVKDKVQLSKNINVDAILTEVAKAFSNEKVNTIDGVKIDFEAGWVHLRKSNTEPIIRIYAEAASIEKAQEFVELIKKFIQS
jgi:phosphomannomutase